jgi:hypothetical protein
VSREAGDCLGTSDWVELEVALVWYDRFQEDDGELDSDSLGMEH